jgi:hypothetical protein
MILMKIIKESFIKLIDNEGNNLNDEKLLILFNRIRIHLKACLEKKL